MKHIFLVFGCVLNITYKGEHRLISVLFFCALFLFCLNMNFHKHKRNFKFDNRYLKRVYIFAV